jgi:hypothetical protein
MYKGSSLQTMAAENFRKAMEERLGHNQELISKLGKYIFSRDTLRFFFLIKDIVPDFEVGCRRPTPVSVQRKRIYARSGDTDGQLVGPWLSRSTCCTQCHCEDRCNRSCKCNRSSIGRWYCSRSRRYNLRNRIRHLLSSTVSRDRLGTRPTRGVEGRTSLILIDRSGWNSKLLQ